jgi:hypothetical protein
VGQRSADHSGADKGNLFPSHEANFLCCCERTEDRAQHFGGALAPKAESGNRVGTAMAGREAFGRMNESETLISAVR